MLTLVPIVLMRGARGGGGAGGPNPPEKLGSLSNTGLDHIKSQSYQASNVGPSLARI